MWAATALAGGDHWPPPRPLVTENLAAGNDNRPGIKSAGPVTCLAIIYRKAAPGKGTNGVRKREWKHWMKTGLVKAGRKKRRMARAREDEAQAEAGRKHGKIKEVLLEISEGKFE